MNQEKHLISGPISPEFVAQKISAHHRKHEIGAHAVFMGQVRADIDKDRTTKGIEYSAYEEMVDKIISGIKDDLFSRFDDLICLHIWHSTGIVEAGEISLFVLVSSGHRKQSFAALEDCIEQIKKKLPVWKKEIFSDGTCKWKEG